MQWLASPDKLLAQPTEMAVVVFDESIEFKQNAKKKNPEKTQMEKTHKKEKKTDHHDEMKPIKINNKQTIPSERDGTKYHTHTE